MKYRIVIPLAIGIIAHLLVKIFNLQGNEPPPLVHTISAVSFILFSLLHGFSFKGYKKTLGFFLITSVIAFPVLFVFMRSGYIFFSKNMLLAGLPWPIVFWLFTLVYNSSVMAEIILREETAGGWLRGLLASLIACGYLAAACPIMYLRGDWGVTFEGMFFKTPIIEYLFGILVIFAIAVIYYAAAKDEKVNNPQELSLKLLSVAFYVWMTFTAIISAFIYEVAGLFIVTFFGMLPYSILALYSLTIEDFDQENAFPN